jgi:chlorite dismutase
MIMTYNSYIFFDSRHSLSKVPENDLTKYRAELETLIEKKKNVKTFVYGTLGFKANTRVMFWLSAESPEEIQDFIREILNSNLGKYLKITYTLFGMKGRSQYSKGQGGRDILPENPRKKYLIVYPFTKTTEWHLLSLDERKQLMYGHMNTAHESKDIEQLLLYAYGVDDHEFVLSYETDSLPDFQALVISLRNTKARVYTKDDLPIFTCLYRELGGVLKLL